ncbi:MAG: FkbM family methyltransferase [Planctomycetota bacterium]|nr:FkbM family methyltransferase [Planctomycetota bacterium]
MHAPQPLDRQVQDLYRIVQVLSTKLVGVSQKIARLEALDALARQGRAPRLPLEFRSQFGEDVMLWDMLGGQTEGFFIEVGAFDGYHFSVSYALEAIGWNGLLIEAIPERAEQCRARRPHSRVEHAALSRRGSTGTVTFTVAEDHYGGMLSYLHPDPSHVRDLDSGKVQRRSVTVPVTTMNDLLKDHTGDIDFASIDVEGGELALLDGFDLHKHRPKVLFIEDNTHGANPALANYMRTQPYVQVAWLEVNRVYVRTDLQQELTARLRRF